MKTELIAKVIFDLSSSYGGRLRIFIFSLSEKKKKVLKHNARYGTLKGETNLLQSML
jgi:hypothetical protein